VTCSNSSNVTNAAVNNNSADISSITDTNSNVTNAAIINNILRTAGEDAAGTSLDALLSYLGDAGGGSRDKGQKRTVTSEASADLQSAQPLQENRADLQSAQPLQENRKPTKDISRQRQAVSLGAFKGSMKGEVSFAKDELVTVLVRCASSPLNPFVLGLGLGVSGCGGCVVRVFRQNVSLEDVNPLGSPPLPLPP
jgi:hypothetical protein